LTNLLFTYLAFKGMYNCYRNGHEWIFFVTFAGYLVVGSGSFLFHATLKCTFGPPIILVPLVEDVIKLPARSSKKWFRADQPLKVRSTARRDDTGWARHRIEPGVASLSAQTGLEGIDDSDRTTLQILCSSSMSFR
jgi:hypothetical protein